MGTSKWRLIIRPSRPAVWSSWPPTTKIRLIQLEDDLIQKCIEDWGYKKQVRRPAATAG
jgi:hypothetical protein